MDFVKTIYVDKAAVSDISQIAKIHKESFSKEHTLTYFSVKTIGNYYLEFINKPNIIFLIYKEKDGLIGFVLGGNGFALQNAKLNYMAHNRSALILECIQNIFNISFMKKMFSVLKDNIKAALNLGKSVEYKSVPSLNVRMLSIAVDENYKKKGIGAYMVDCFEQLLKEKGIKCYGLSARRQNLAARKFYKAKGFKIYKETDIAFYYYKDIK